MGTCESQFKTITDMADCFIGRKRLRWEDEMSSATAFQERALKHMRLQCHERRKSNWELLPRVSREGDKSA